MLVDTHCHIHESDYPIPLEPVLANAQKNNVGKMILVGTDEKSSHSALTLASQHDNLYASVGVHPHETKYGYDAITGYAKNGAIAIGEIGLDYYYEHSPRDVQIAAFEAQIEIALAHSLPIIFHVRDAFEDFWPIFDNFKGIHGVLHSFTDSMQNIEKAFSRGLYVGVNGISTFTKDPLQQRLYASIPLDKMLLETDSPFLTPIPYRGTINEPAFVSEIARFHARIRGINLSEVARVTTSNALTLFNI
jgi:TatD DNase family protein